MFNPVSVRERITHKLLWDFDIQKDHQISARIQDLIILNNNKKKKKKKREIVNFVVPADYRIKLKKK